MNKKDRIILFIKLQSKILICLLFFLNKILFTQEISEYIYCNGNSLMLNDKPFYSIGFNSYYLQNLAAYNDTLQIIEVLSEAKKMGTNVIRTWGFYDSPDNSDNAVIQFSPGKFNEEGLQALDYVIAKANEYKIRLIIPLVNNWEEYGGINQYVQWYSELFPETLPKIFQQKIIEGIEGRFYRYFITSNLTHDDFYINDTIKGWYKNYISTIINRTNSFTGISYKNDPTILAWELANEPRSSDLSGRIIYKWADEISTYIKLLDDNHLVSTGEEGFDIFSDYYDIGKYGNQKWLFDGSNGISFYLNTSLPNIDIASIHFYPEAWGLTKDISIDWLNDHKKISNEFNKPIIIGEVAARKNVHLFYESIFNESYYQDFSLVIPWQFVYDDRPDYDGYSFYFPDDSLIINVIKKYSHLFNEKQNGVSSPITSDLQLQNYPNPFNQVTIITYNLVNASFVDILVYNITGQLIKTLVQENQIAGIHSIIFDSRSAKGGLASGIYFVKLSLNNKTEVLKINLIR